MRAVRYLGPEKGVALVRNAPEPAPAPGEALIRPLRLGIGWYEKLLTAGKGPPEPITLGREFVGLVEKVNAGRPASDRARSLVGRRVVGSINAVCGECDLCRAGLSNHCRARTILGVRARDGCFADAFCLPVMNLVPVPDEIDDDTAVFAEPVAAAIQAAQQLRIEGKPYVTVLGDGCIGLLCAQIMARLNASVRIIGRHESKMSLAERWGIKHRHERDIGRRADQDVVVDCTGSSTGLELAMRLVRPRGKILLKSAGAGPLPAGLDLSPLVSNEIELIGSRCGSMSEAIAVLRRAEVDVVSLITKRARLDDATAALRLSVEPQQLKVLIDL